MIQNPELNYFYFQNTQVSTSNQNILMSKIFIFLTYILFSYHTKKYPYFCSLDLFLSILTDNARMEMDFSYNSCCPEFVCISSHLRRRILYFDLDYFFILIFFYFNYFCQQYSLRIDLSL